MSSAAISPDLLRGFEAAHAGEGGRWTRSLGFVLAAHAAAIALAIGWATTTPRPIPNDVAIEIDLPPLATADEIAAPAAAAPAAAPEPQPQPRPQPTPVVEQPRPTPVVAHAEVPIPVAPPAPAPVAAPSAAPAEAAGLPTGTATGIESSSGTAARSAAMPGSGRSGGDAAAVWRGRVLAHLDRHKRYPQAARVMKREGRVQVQLAVDRMGRVMAMELGKGAGFKPFDQEAMETVRRADPLPPPPPELAGDRIPLVVPIGFYPPGPR